MDFNSWASTRQASKLNLAGVGALAQGRWGLAIHHLNAALNIINPLLLKTCEQYDAASRLRRPSLEHRHISLISDLSRRPQTKEIPHMSDDTFYVYNHALLFNPSALSSFGNHEPNFEDIEICYVEISFIWSVIHFNMALVLHKACLDTSSERYREESLLFYKLCLQNLWVIPATCDAMNMLILVAINNFGHVQIKGAGVDMHMHCMGNYKEQLETTKSLLLRAIGKVLFREDRLTSEQNRQVVEISFNHIILTVLRPSYIAPGA